LAGKKQRLLFLENQMAASEFWHDPEHAKLVIDEANSLKAWLEPYEESLKRFKSAAALLQEIEEQQDPEFFQECINELDGVLVIVEELEVKKMLSSELDTKSCYLTVNAGAGGTEACDWAMMLVRMYQRWGAKRGWKVQLIDTVEGDVVGIKSATLNFQGPFAYGYAKAEKGVHRLVRISPFDSNAKRHTSFASVDVSPEVDLTIEITLRPEDLRIDTFRSSGAGGQHVNTTDSAVRITHLPSGLVVSCQSERSQLQNKETCLKMLKSKLYEKQVMEREEALRKESGEKKEIAWGSQIRNYVFHPYTLVKDTRTKYETSQVQDVMDGDLDGFIKAYLKEFG
jgi:peptide chain release factor 2